MANFSFDVLYIGNPCECPLCGAQLKDEAAITVKSNSYDRGKPFKTSIGTGDFEGFVMDPDANNSTLILNDEDPDIACTECNERLLVDSHTEV